MSIGQTEKWKAVLSGVGQGFTGILGSGKASLQNKISKAEETLAIDKLKLEAIAAGYEKAANKSEFLNKNLEGTSEAAKDFAKDLVQGTRGTDQFVLAQEKQIAALKASSLSSKVAAAGMKALTVAMNVGLVLAANAAISWVAQLVTKQEKARKAAANAAQAFQEESNSIDSYKAKISELKSALDSGSLSHQEAYDKRKALIAIQDEIIAKYGAEAGAIDLVNGSISQQAGLLDDVLRRKASENLTQFGSVYDNAKRNRTQTQLLDITIKATTNQTLVAAFNIDIQNDDS